MAKTQIDDWLKLGYTEEEARILQELSCLPITVSIIDDPTSAMVELVRTPKEVECCEN